MLHVDRVLFPTDGSDSAERARRHALRLANRFDAVLHVIHVEQERADLPDVVDTRETEVLAALHTSSAEEEPILAAPRVRERTVRHATPSGGILSYAAEHDTNLIVLGTHGRRGVRRLVVGSVAEEVVRRAPRPVVTVGRGAEAPEEMEGGHMLVPVDFSEHQNRLLAHAREIALAYGMKMTLFHVLEMEGFPGAYGVYAKPSRSGILVHRMEGVLENLAERLRDFGLDVAAEVREGNPSREILGAIDDLDACFAAIATHGRSGIDRVLMGSVAETVIRRASCPVCTVKSYGTSLVVEDEEGPEEAGTKEEA